MKTKRKSNRRNEDMKNNLRKTENSEGKTTVKTKGKLHESHREKGRQRREAKGRKRGIGEGEKEKVIPRDRSRKRRQTNQNSYIQMKDSYFFKIFSPHLFVLTLFNPRPRKVKQG